MGVADKNGNEKTIVIIGASPKKERYSNKAIRAYKSQGWTVFAVNPKYAGQRIEGVLCHASVAELPETPKYAGLYVRPEIGIKIIPEIAKKGIKHVYVNPGTESPELLDLGKKLGLDMIVACAIRSIGLDPDRLDDIGLIVSPGGGDGR